MPKKPPYIGGAAPPWDPDFTSPDRNPDGSLKKKSRPNLTDSLKPLMPNDPVRQRRQASGFKPRRPKPQQAIPASVGTGTDDGTAKPEVDSDDETKWEIFRKISYSIVTQDGAYELPPDWTGEDDSPTWDDDLPDPGDPWFKVERVHEIGYIVEANRKIIIEKMYVPLLDGPTGSFSAVLTVVNAGIDDHVPFSSRIPYDLLISDEAGNAIAKAINEI